jgi:hypothetical protein
MRRIRDSLVPRCLFLSRQHQAVVEITHIAHPHSFCSPHPIQLRNNIHFGLCCCCFLSCAWRSFVRSFGVHSSQMVCIECYLPFITALIISWCVREIVTWTRDTRTLGPCQLQFVNSTAQVLGLHREVRPPAASVACAEEARRGGQQQRRWCTDGGRRRRAGERRARPGCQLAGTDTSPLAYDVHRQYREIGHSQI